MKVKLIQNLKDLKAGFYIRAYVNNFGRVEFDSIELCGKPFIVNHKGSIGKSWKMVQKSNFYRNRTTEEFVTTLIGTYPNIPVRLYRHTPMLTNYLNSIKGDPHKFLAFLLNVEVTKEFIKKNEDDWERAEQEDKYMDAFWENTR